MSQLICTTEYVSSMYTVKPNNETIVCIMKRSQPNITSPIDSTLGSTPRVSLCPLTLQMLVWIFCVNPFMFLKIGFPYMYL